MAKSSKQTINPYSPKPKQGGKRAVKLKNKHKSTKEYKSQGRN